MRGKSVKGSTTPTKTQQVVYRCTACQGVIKSHHDAILHPLLDTLICLQCHAKYGTGDFAQQWSDGVDELGDDNYCRWCCDGGSLIGCSTGMEDETKERCHYMFCQDCIKHNLPDEPILKNAEEAPDQPAMWFCFVCDRTKLRKLRSKAQAAINDLKARETSSLIPDITPRKNPVGRPPKNRYMAGRDNGASASTPSISNSYSKPCPASKKPQAQQAAQSSIQDDIMDIDIMSVSPSKPSAKSPTIEDDVLIMPQKETERKDESGRIVKDNGATSGQDKSKDKDREAGRKSSISFSKDPGQSSSAVNKESSKKVKENGLSKREKEARVEGEPIVAPADAELFKPKGSIHTTRDVRRVSDSFSPANPMKKRRTDSLSTENLSSRVPSNTPKKIPDNDKASAPTTKETGLEPQMIYARTVTVDRQQTYSNGSSEPKQNNRQSSANGRETPGSANTAINSSNTKVGPTNVVSIPEGPKQKANTLKPTSYADIKKRLDLYSKTKQICIEEIGFRFEKIIDMISKCSPSSDKGSKHSISVEIGSLRKPMQEFEAMIRDLENLCC